MPGLLKFSESISIHLPRAISTFFDLNRASGAEVDDFSTEIKSAVHEIVSLLKRVTPRFRTSAVGFEIKQIHANFLNRHTLRLLTFNSSNEFRFSIITFENFIIHPYKTDF